MLPLFSWTISAVVIALSGVDARAVDTNITSIPTTNISLIISDLNNATASPQSCTDIKSCRTLDQIIVSCLVTILACVWFAVHRNIPAAKPKPSHHPNIFIRTAQRAWSLVLDQRESAIVFVAALLAPEWILAWALRQAFTAWRLTGKLEKARAKAVAAQNGRHSTVADSESGTGGISESVEGHSSFDRSAASLTDDKNIQLINRHPNTRNTVDICEKCAARGSQCDLFSAAKRVGKADECWRMLHAFFAIMGGFCFCDEEGPIRPLSPEDVLELVARGHLVPPTAEEISNQSKGDALSKGVAIIQTLWFVMQCIVRRAEDLPVTRLEVMTLAYTVMTVAMYIAWWHKPLNVSCAVRVPEEEVGYSGADIKYGLIWQRIGVYVVGGQDSYVDLRQCKRVPTFWAGKADGSDFWITDVIALLVAMVFGAVHCVAWYSKFQTDLELQLWRYSAIVIIAVPVALVVVIPVGLLIAACIGSNEETAVGALYIPVALIYIAARLILISLSFTSLRGLPSLHTRPFIGPRLSLISDLTLIHFLLLHFISIYLSTCSGFIGQNTQWARAK